ncbi:MAG: hypothetical protein ACFCUR_14370 [Rhodomicrobiaceae bacterium]
MLNGNWYGLIITLLTLIIAVILTVRHVSDTGIRFEVVIQPVPVIRPKDDGGRQMKDSQSDQNSGKKHTEQLAAG